MLGRGDSRLRRIGLTVLVILLGAFALTLILAWRYHLDMAEEVESTVSGGGGLAALYLTWIAVKSSLNATLDATSRRLVDEVTAQWEGGKVILTFRFHGSLRRPPRILVRCGEWR